MLQLARDVYDAARVRIRGLFVGAFLRAAGWKRIGPDAWTDAESPDGRFFVLTTEEALVAQGWRDRGDA